MNSEIEKTCAKCTYIIQLTSIGPSCLQTAHYCEKKHPGHWKLTELLTRTNNEIRNRFGTMTNPPHTHNLCLVYFTNWSDTLAHIITFKFLTDKHREWNTKHYFSFFSTVSELCSFVISGSNKSIQNCPFSSKKFATDLDILCTLLFFVWPSS